ncbi:MAG: LCP family protein [Lachnospiraceae bacterium]|nr:LCP family protein [Lachnospiraceae bacterium]
MATSQAAKRRAMAKKRARKKRNKILLLIAEFFVLVLLVVVVYGVTKAEKVTKVKIDEEEIKAKMNDTVAENVTLKGYKNIALFGVDSREGSLGKGTRSDTIIIASINNDTGDIRLCSVYRDTYLNLGNDSYNKCNAAYAKGGPEQAINMLNMNMDLDITDYVTVGFEGLIETIDALGGVYIDVQQNEIVHLNNYQISMVGKTTDKKTYTATEGVDYIAVKEPGMQLLNGLQATAYCRIRYVGDDFMRAKRQRTVLAAVMDVCKKSDPATLNKILNAALPNVSTSLDVDEMTAMLSNVTKYNITGSDGFPFESNRATGTVGSKGSCVIPVNLEQNVSLLHDFLFDDAAYQVSAQVKQYSNKISSDTGR